MTCVQNETFILPGRELIKLEFTFFIVAHISGSPSSSSRAPSACLTFATGAVSWRNSLLASPNLLLSTHLICIWISINKHACLGAIQDSRGKTYWSSIWGYVGWQKLTTGRFFLLPYSHILGASWYWCWYGYPIPSLLWITVNPSATPPWPFKIRIKSAEILKSKFDQPVSEFHYFKSNFSDIWRLLHFSE